MRQCRVLGTVSGRKMGQAETETGGVLPFRADSTSSLLYPIVAWTRGGSSNQAAAAGRRLGFGSGQTSHSEASAGSVCRGAWRERGVCGGRSAMVAYGFANIWG